MKAKKLLAIGMTLLMTAGMAGCGNAAAGGSAATTAQSDTTTAAGASADAAATAATKQAAAASDENSVTTTTGGDLNMSWWGGDSRHEATMKALDAYKAKSGVTVSYSYGAWSGWEDSMAAMFSTNTAPDVNQINWNWIYQYDAAGDKFVDLNTVSDTLDLTQFDQKYLDMCTKDGKLAAVPISMTGRIFYWDKTTFDKAGISTPTSLAELEAAGKTFKEKLGDDYYPLAIGEYDRMILMVTYLESKYGKNWVEDGKLQYDEKQVQEGLEFIQKLETEHVIPSLATIAGDGADSIDKNDKWINGKYAGIYEWDSAASKYKSSLAEGNEFVVGDEFKDMGKYQGGFTKVSMAFAISTTCKDPEKAAALLQYLLNDDEGTTILATERGIPVSKAAYANLEKQNLLDPDVAEANKKVMDYNSFQIDPTFEASELKSTDGVYYDVFGGLSYGDYDSATAAQTLIDGVNTVLSAN
jgi:oligogalacturonide transport system substrate-binding protein